MSTRTATARHFGTRKLVTMGMLCAMAIVLVALLKVPIIPAAPFLIYDPADIPILIGTLVYGPVAGLVMTVVVSLIQGLLLDTSGGGPIGIVMHIAATGAMALVVGMLYRSGKATMRRAGGSLLAGVFTMTAVMVGMNLLLTPIFMNTDIDVVLKMLVPAILPFNLLKAGINSAATFLVYRAVERMAAR